MAKILSDAEVFGAPAVMSEEDVFGPRAGSTAAPMRADPKIGQPAELSWMEKLASAMDKPGSVVDWWGSGNLRGSELGRVLKGAADPGAAAVQMMANVLPGDDGKAIGNAVNAGIKEREGEYQDARKAAGSEGFDPLRAAGATGISLLVPGATAGTTALRGAAVGAGAGALDPVVDGGDNFWGDKARQIAIGAAGGAVMTPLLGALARVVSPKASTNAELALLRSEGVRPSVGQALGGWANTAEEKAMSWPVLGDMITKARRGAVEDFNNATINRAVAPIGERVKGAGHEAVAEAGDKLSAAYEKVLGSVNHVGFNTPAFNAQFGQLQQMATGLAEPLQKRFEAGLRDAVLRKMSPNGSILGADLKLVDSELGALARKWGRSTDVTQQELGDAFKQLQAIIREEVKASSPELSRQLRAADKGWASLVRVEGAAKRAANAEGVFTPGQSVMAIRGADSSVRGRATARGEALGQDLATAGQNVLGNKYPDSGTPGRLLQGVGALAAGGVLVHPAIPAALVGGALAYTKPVQNMLVKLLANRPEDAPRVANYLRRLTGPGSLAAGELAGDRR